LLITTSASQNVESVKRVHLSIFIGSSLGKSLLIDGPIILTNNALNIFATQDLNHGLFLTTTTDSGLRRVNHLTPKP
jgi:hypothetical protein